MATLTGNSVGTSYLGLIKTTDNAVIGATEKNLTDGAGNASTLSVGTTSATITGNLDLTGATVTGLAGAGLVAGTGTDSMKSDDSLTTVSSLAQGARSIAIGDGAIANSDGAIAIGSVANVPPSPRPDYIAIGQDVFIAQNSIAIGYSTSAQVDKGVVIGYDAFASGNGAVSLGNLATTTAVNGVALGTNVTAAIQDTVSLKALEVQTDSTPTAGGIIISDAGGTDRRLNIDASGGLQIDSTPVGGGGAAGLVSGTGTDSMQSASTLTTTAANASAGYTIALGENAKATGDSNVAIGNASSSGGSFATAIGRSATTTGAQSTAVGFAASAGGGSSLALGRISNAGGGDAVAIGNSSNASSNYRIAIGVSSIASGTGNDGAIAIGKNSSATDNRALAIGFNCDAGDTGSVVIGDDSTINTGNDRAMAIGSGILIPASSGSDSITIGTDAGAYAQRAISIGQNSTATTATAVAIGYGVAASTANTVTVKKLQMLDYATLDFADDTAAATGGIPLGGVYHTSGALKIRVA